MPSRCMLKIHLTMSILHCTRYIAFTTIKLKL
uniref:Uncharacterized protein n=1 Tax=Rhizophora mucronata TaxID=61149 RepID=A0A2P2NSQ5_RHIMU